MKSVMAGRPIGERILPNVCPAMHTVQKAKNRRTICPAHPAMHPL